MHKDCSVANTQAETPDVVANIDRTDEISDCAVANSRHGKHADPESRRAYMREYMAKRRAK